MPDIFVKPEGENLENESSTDSVLDKKHKTQGAKAQTKIHNHMFASFCQSPSQIAFQTQERDEAILLFLRKHFATNIHWVFITFVLSLIPLVLVVIESRFAVFSTLNIPSRFVTIFTLFYYLIITQYAFINFITWFYNVFIVTKKRVIDIDYSDIVIHNLAVTKLSHILDVNYTQSGFIRSLFNYGDVFAQTAGEETNFEALAVPQPREASHIIANLIGKEAHER